MRDTDKKDMPKIDFVLLWVDSNDKKWQKDYIAHKREAGDSREFRFRDMDTLRYWFRGIEKYASWVNKIYFVTNGQVPDWLNRSNPKIVLVSHSDYMPKEYLPTFSSHAIELNLNRIKDLSETFIYFNDDTFLINEVKPETFFKKGLPRLCAVMDSYTTRDDPPFFVPQANAAVLNRHFEKKDVLKKYFPKYYTPLYGKFLIKNVQFAPGRGFYGFKMYHMPVPMLKSTLSEIWKNEYKVLHQTSLHKFRVMTDVNQWLVQNWQMCKGEFYPQDIKIGEYIAIRSDADLKKADTIINDSKKLMVCLNDTSDIDFDHMVEELKKSFEKKFPNKSSFEL